MVISSTFLRFLAHRASSLSNKRHLLLGGSDGAYKYFHFQQECHLLSFEESKFENLFI